VNEREIDYACAVVRLRQIKNCDDDLLADHLLDRVLNCDLPRLERYLTAEQWVAIIDAESGVADVLGASASSGESREATRGSIGSDKG